MFQKFKDSLILPKIVQHKKKISFLLLALLIVGIILPKISAGKNSPSVPIIYQSDLSTIEQTDFTKEIKGTGVVESKDLYQVYGSLSYPVTEIHVNIGDTVQEGDILALLDTSSIEEQIQLKQVEISQSSNSSSLQINQAQRKYEEELLAIEEQTNSSIANAKQALDNATRTMLSANETYENSNGNEQLYKEATTAQYNYLQAVENYDLALINAEKSLKTYADSLDSAMMSSNLDSLRLSLSNLENSLLETIITAPTSGTITAIYATIGTNATGILFIIEDLDQLVVEVAVGESDVLHLSLDMPVQVTLNIANSPSYPALVTKIAPTAQKDNLGSTLSGTSPTYLVEIEIQEKNTPLLVGMNVKTDFILEEVKDVLTIPNEYLYENSTGENCVLLVEAIENVPNTYLVTEEVVTLGSADNFVQIVEGATLLSGMEILKYSESNYTYVNQEVLAIDESTPNNNTRPGGFPF